MSKTVVVDLSESNEVIERDMTPEEENTLQIIQTLSTQQEDAERIIEQNLKALRLDAVNSFKTATTIAQLKQALVKFFRYMKVVEESEIS